MGLVIEGETGISRNIALGSPLKLAIPPGRFASGDRHGLAEEIRTTAINTDQKSIKN